MVSRISSIFTLAQFMSTTLFVLGKFAREKRKETAPMDDYAFTYVLRPTLKSSSSSHSFFKGSCWEGPEDDDGGGGDDLPGLLERHGRPACFSRSRACCCACELQRTARRCDSRPEPTPPVLPIYHRAVQICRGDRTKTRDFLCAPPLPA